MLLHLKKKLFPKRYLSPWLILAIDVFCSVLASACTLLMFVLIGKMRPEMAFSLTWLGDM